MVRLWSCIENRAHTGHFVLMRMVHAFSWIWWLLCALWPECVLVYACTLSVFFFIGVLFKKISPCQHMFPHRMSIAETCKTWQQMASSTMRDSAEHDSLAHIVNLFCQKRKKNPPACLKWNGLISKIPELSDSCEIVFADLSLSCIMEPRSNSVRYTLKKDFIHHTFPWHFNCTCTSLRSSFLSAILTVKGPENLAHCQLLVLTLLMVFQSSDLNVAATWKYFYLTLHLSIDKPVY